MIDIDQYILLFIQEKTTEMEEFKDYIKSSNLPNRKIAYKEWETAYLNWAISKEDAIEKKEFGIYLNYD